MKAAGFPFSALGQQDEFQQSIQNVWADLLIIGINLQKCRIMVYKILGGGILKIVSAYSGSIVCLQWDTRGSFDSVETY